MIARVCGCADSSRSAAISSVIIASDSALRRSGRFMVIVATVPSRTCSCSYATVNPPCVHRP